MIGTLDQARSRSSTSAASMSGKPRSTITCSGGLSVAHRSASPPVSASCTTKPSSSRPARRKRRICSSSSTTRTTGLASSVIGTDLGLALGGCDRQVNRHDGSLTGPRARRLHLAAIGGDEGLGDPEPQPRARYRRRVERPAKESLAEMRILLGGQADALVRYRKHHVMAVTFGGDRDRRTRARGFRGVGDDLHEGLL